MSVSSQLPQSFLLEVARGRINGISSFTLVGINSAVGSDTEDIIDQGGTFVYPTAAETWEVVSDNAADDTAGTGGRTVLITGLDTDHNDISETVTLNGTTPVVTTETTWFRTKAITLLTAGSSESNKGTITVRVSGGGVTRLQMSPTNSTSFSGLFTVPAGKTAYAIQSSIFIPKNEDVILTTVVRANTADAPFLKAGPVSIYQNSNILPILAHAVLPEKTDLRFTARSTNRSVSITSITELFLVDAVEGGVQPLNIR